MLQKRVMGAAASTPLPLVLSQDGSRALPLRWVPINAPVAQLHHYDMD